MKSFEQKAKESISEIIINKSFIHNSGFGNRSIPTYVGEWIVSHFVGEAEQVTELAKERMAKFVNEYIPAKGEKESIKNTLLDMKEVKLLDNYNVAINLQKGDRYLSIPFLDISNAQIPPQIVENNNMLLSSGLWGVGTLFYIPPSTENPSGQVWMRDLKPFQIANIDLEYYCEARKNFEIEEWIDFIISSMGFNPDLYNEKQKIYLICRLIPLIESRYSLVELAPKGTGKSFVYDNMSRYVAVRTGNISPAVLFFNDARKSAGLITRYDTVVLDEAQKLKGDSSGELTALLKSYLESGKFGKGSASAIIAEAGMVILANIELDENKNPLNEIKGLFKVFPNFLRETAFIDRFSGFLPGWYLPRISKNTPSKYFGLKGDIFGEIMHKMRNDLTYRNYVKSNMELTDCNDMRDSKAIESGATGLFKLLFPNKEANEHDFYKYCVNPAIELRQRVRDELCKMDREYSPVTILSKFPDSFQINHVKPNYYEEEDELNIIVHSEFETSQNDKLSEFIPTNIKKKEKPIEKCIEIDENEMGYSFEKIFGPYLRNAVQIRVEDPYIQLEYQIRNLLSFCELFDTDKGPIDFMLVTNYNDDDQKTKISEKFEIIKNTLKVNQINFEYTFDPALHDRLIVLNNGWEIKPGRGLDIFKAPEYGLFMDDQEQRKCRKCRIDFKRVKTTISSNSNLPQELKTIIEEKGIKHENILFLRIAVRHLKRIADGSKNVEFRDLTDYYLSRLQYVNKDNEATGLKPKTHILFQGGYNANSPYMLIEMTDWYSKEANVKSTTPEGDKLRREAEKEGFTDEDEYIGLFLGKILFSQV